MIYRPICDYEVFLCFAGGSTVSRPESVIHSLPSHQLAIPVLHKMPPLFLFTRDDVAPRLKTHVLRTPLAFVRDNGNLQLLGLPYPFVHTTIHLPMRKIVALWNGHIHV